MGLFSNDKKPCPICGSATPRLLATKIADKTPICSDCSRKVSMDDSKIGALSVDELKEHLTLRAENAKYLESIFKPTKKIGIGFTDLNIDGINKVFTLPTSACGDTKNPPIFKFEELMGYELRIDYDVVERFGRGDSSPQITPMIYRTAVVLYDKEEKPQDETCSSSLILYLTNPCWDKVEYDAGSISARKELLQYEINKHLDNLRLITAALQEIIKADVKEDVMQNNSNSAADEIMKFKELLDSGIISEEEFSAKKKQLLGI